MRSTREDYSRGRPCDELTETMSFTSCDTLRRSQGAVEKNKNFAEKSPVLSTFSCRFLLSDRRASRCVAGRPAHNADDAAREFLCYHGPPACKQSRLASYFYFFGGVTPPDPGCFAFFGICTCSNVDEPSTREKVPRTTPVPCSPNRASSLLVPSRSR